MVQFDANMITFDSISKAKLLGQKLHKQRLNRQLKMNPRQLKKLRKKQQEKGLLGSKFSGICSIKLKPASAFMFYKD